MTSTRPSLLPAHTTILRAMSCALFLIAIPSLAIAQDDFDEEMGSEAFEEGSSTSVEPVLPPVVDEEAEVIPVASPVRPVSDTPTEPGAPEQTQPPATQEKTQDAEPVSVAGPYRSFRGGIVLVDGSRQSDPIRQWTLTFGGYIRMAYRAVQDDPNIQFFGRNDGFVYANARPYFSGRLPSGIGFRFQFEAAATLPPASSVQPFEQQVMRPRDAFVSYEPMPALNLQFGQFKPPHNLEELLPTADLLFADRSVGGDGVSAFDGRPIPGLALPREIGAQLTGQIYFLDQSDHDSTPYGPGVSYAIAVTNGSRAALTFNDNDALAYHGRASLHWGKILSLGGGYYFNRISVLNTQDSIDKDLSGLTGDIKLDIAGVQLLASYQQLLDETTFLSDQNPADEAKTFTLSRAYMAQIGYTIPVVRLQPAYRIAFYDPTADYNQIDPQAADIREVDELTYHTFALNYRPEAYPVTLMLNYTLTQEDQARTLRNNNLTALVQLIW